ncbi:MAG: beta-ketoacyl-[acyl-carrier-protein] synthase family protein [bacterium]
MDEKVVVTGIGVITSVGMGKEEFWNSLICGKEGIKEITSFDTRKYKCRKGGEIERFTFPSYLKKADRSSQLLATCVEEAISDAKLDLDKEDKEMTGVVIGTALGGILSGEKIHFALKNNQQRKIKSLFLEYPLHRSAEYIRDRFNLKGSIITLSNACTSSSNAIGYAYNLIRYKRSEIMIVGGVDTLSQFVFSGFNSLRILTEDKCRPFDKKRDGLVLGEGAGVIILERLHHALYRNAHIYAEIVGYSNSCDACHISAPDKESDGAYQAIKIALKEAKLKIKDIDYIHLHGNGTIYNDRMESTAIKRAFGVYKEKIPVSAIKAMTGYTLGASGVIDGITCILIMNNNFIPPIINYATPDSECNLNFVTNKGKKRKVKISLSLSSGFGGANTVILFKKYSGRKHNNGKQ